MTRTSPNNVVRVVSTPGEKWWGGAVADGQVMPFGGAPLRRDLAVNAGAVDDPASWANQSAPLLVSSGGRYVWSEKPFTFSFSEGELTICGGDVVVVQAPGTASLSAAFRAAADAHFPACGRAPALGMFHGPQYNTWMELPYAPTQRGVLDYVREMLDIGFPPGVVIIDDLWGEDYGTWRFDRAAFPDPSAMVSTLHDWGCPVMLWLVPFVSPDSAISRELVARDLVVRDHDGRVGIRQWWNGFSIAIDLTNPEAEAWLHAELGTLQNDHGVDGFKFDGGDLRHYRQDDRTHRGDGPVGQCEAWARFASAYEYNELRACWKMGGAALAQRLHDKPGVWDDHGLASVIPESIAQGLIGHAFGCPDMVGGGELGATARDTVDQDLFVRYAQCAAFHPMIQFSLAPQRVLDIEHLAAVLEAVRLRQELLPELLAMVDTAAVTGEPILRPLVYDFPDENPGIIDQFTLGGSVLVAPVLRPGLRERTVRLPPADWADRDGAIHHGPGTITVPVQLSTIPVFRRADAR